MGIFFESREKLPILSAALEEALQVNPLNIVDLKSESENRALELTPQMESKFRWGRLAFAVLLLIALFAGGLYAAAHQLDDWNKALIHSFELVLGLVIGMLSGEAAGQH